jgi:hypothetical protein
MKKLIIDKGKAKRKVDPSKVAEALGAEEIGKQFASSFFQIPRR